MIDYRAVLIQMETKNISHLLFQVALFESFLSMSNVFRCVWDMSVQLLNVKMLNSYCERMTGGQL